VIQLPSRQDLRLTATRYLVVPQGVFDLDPPVPGHVVATAQGYDLVEVSGAEGLVSVVTDWRLEASTASALRPLLRPDFDPGREAILEEDPGIRDLPGSSVGRASWGEEDAQHLRIEVEAPAPAIVVVRTAYDEGWHATVDGEDRRVFATDGFLQGIPVDAGSHVIELEYRDRAVAAGLGISAAAWVGLLAGYATALIMERRERRLDARLRRWSPPDGHHPSAPEALAPHDPATALLRTAPRPAGEAPGTP
jgi:hypothetical protein